MRIVELSTKALRLARQYSRALNSNDNATIKRILKLADRDPAAFAAVEYVHGRRDSGWEADDECVPGSTEDGGCEA